VACLLWTEIDERKGKERGRGGEALYFLKRKKGGLSFCGSSIVEKKEKKIIFQKGNRGGRCMASINALICARKRGRNMGANYLLLLLSTKERRGGRAGVSHSFGRALRKKRGDFSSRWLRQREKGGKSSSGATEKGESRHDPLSHRHRGKGKRGKAMTAGRGADRLCEGKKRKGSDHTPTTFFFCRGREKKKRERGGTSSGEVNHAFRPEREKKKREKQPMEPRLATIENGKIQKKNVGGTRESSDGSCRSLWWKEKKGRKKQRTWSVPGSNGCL